MKKLTLLLVGFFCSLFAGKEHVYITDVVSSEVMSKALDTLNCPEDIFVWFFNDNGFLSSCAWCGVRDKETMTLEYCYKVDTLVRKHTSLELELNDIGCSRCIKFVELKDFIKQYYDKCNAPKMRCEEEVRMIVERIKAVLLQYDFKNKGYKTFYYAKDGFSFSIMVDMLDSSVHFHFIEPELARCLVKVEWRSDPQTVFIEIAKCLNQQDQELFLRAVLTDEEKRVVLARRSKQVAKTGYSQKRIADFDPSSQRASKIGVGA